MQELKQMKRVILQDFNPEDLIGLGGYTALKTALKNKEIQGALKDYAS